MTSETLTQERIKEILHYDPNTGIFVWKVSRGSMKAGSIAGSLDSHGYIQIKVDKILHLSHRLAILYMEGAFPVNHIDHINHIRNDNRYRNIRSCTRKENNKNRTINKNNKSGAIGVCWHKAAKKWVAAISIDKKVTHLGTFKEKNHAIIARWLAEDKYEYHENHGV